jgi:hypothetical protein
VVSIDPDPATWTNGVPIPSASGPYPTFMAAATAAAADQAALNRGGENDPYPFLALPIRLFPPRDIEETT